MQNSKYIQADLPNVQYILANMPFVTIYAYFFVIVGGRSKWLQITWGVGGDYIVYGWQLYNPCVRQHLKVNSVQVAQLKLVTWSGCVADTWQQAFPPLLFTIWAWSNLMTLDTIYEACAGCKDVTSTFPKSRAIARVNTEWSKNCRRLSWC